MKAGIVIDDWKLPIFSRRLVAAEFAYEQLPGLSKGTLLLTVKTDRTQALAQLCLAANTEAARQGRSK